jgi:LPS sulfotransferase NodH
MCAVKVILVFPDRVLMSENSNLLGRVLDQAMLDLAEQGIRTLLADPDGEPSVPLEMPGNATNYIICYVPRSGSSHLTSLLQNTGLAGKPADFLNVYYQKLTLEAQRVFERTGVHSVADASENYGSASVADYMHTVARATRSPNGVFGMKMDIAQATILVQRGLFWNPIWNWKYIYLTRQDLLMQAISHFTAIKSGLWSYSSTGQPVTYDENEIVAEMLNLGDMMRRWEAIIGLLGIEPLRITYEDLEADTEGTLRRCLRHLGVACGSDPLPIRSYFKKQRTSEAGELAQRIRSKARGTFAALPPG